MEWCLVDPFPFCRDHRFPFWRKYYYCNHLTSSVSYMKDQYYPNLAFQTLQGGFFIMIVGATGCIETSHLSDSDGCQATCVDVINWCLQSFWFMHNATSFKIGRTKSGIFLWWDKSGEGMISESVNVSKKRIFLAGCVNLTWDGHGGWSKTCTSLQGKSMCVTFREAGFGDKWGQILGTQLCFGRNLTPSQMTVQVKAMSGNWILDAWQRKTLRVHLSSFKMQLQEEGVLHQIFGSAPSLATLSAHSLWKARLSLPKANMRSSGNALWLQ